MPRKTILFSHMLLTNIGCEIIIRGSIAFLERAFPDHALSFVVSSYDAPRDRAILADIPNVRVVPMLRWKRYARGVLRKSGLFVRRWTPRFATAEFLAADLVCSVGGDIYSMFGDALPEDWMGYEVFATKHVIPAMMFGANMERFEILSAPDRAALVDHLKRFRILVLRDQATADYLAGHGVSENVEVFPDPIFSLRPRTVFERSPVRTVGINFTPILVRDYGQPVIDRFARLVEALVADGYRVRFIPHVHSTDGIASLHDPLALERLHAALSPAAAAAVEPYRGALSLAGVAAAIDAVDLLIGARMHAGLNALTLGKAVCFVSYSRKARSMVEWLRSRTPFSAMAQSYRAVPADAITIDDVRALIAAHDGWARAEGPPVEIDTRAYLDSLPVWDRLSPALAFDPSP